MSTATTAFRRLIGGQLEALARVIAEQNDAVQLDKALQLAQEQAARLDLTTAGKGKGRRQAARKPKAPLEPSEQCVARVWRSGSGQDQCHHRRQGDAEYCRRHARQAEVTEQPCQVDAAGKKRGLWFGRIDSAELPWKGNDGTIRIEWDTTDHKALVAKALAAGEAHRHPGARSQRQSKPKKGKATPSTVESEQLAGLLAPASAGARKKVTFTSRKPAAPDALEPHHERVLELALPLEAEREQHRLAPPQSPVNDPADGDELDALLDECAESPATISVTVEKDASGKEWFVDQHGKVYDKETQAEVGTWNKSASTVTFSDS